ncbi:SDR family NAD(P)-dependent oxidoreductase [uncultured Jatrophihabitans sp.]|uniref:SDR family NAD(P)-dependent oxidoreductase n=1 Tax=uncultured Jatrophihabitans sp. TaxID=1610747 RepID=UPI0035CB0FD6
MQVGQLLNGGRAIVVGGGGMGNGRAIGRGIAAAGARVALVDIDPARVAEAVVDVEAQGGAALGLVGDVRDQAVVERIVAEAVEWLGGLDTLVTVVGGYSLFAKWAPLAEVTDDQWNLIMDLNLTYVVRFAREAIRVFLDQGSGGSIVSIGSISGNVASPYGAAYGAAKAALTNLAKSVSVEYGDKGIRMNVLSCGVIATEAQQANYPDGGGLAERIPAGRPGRPEEIANAVVFLASPYASYVSGQNLTADGSLTSRFPLPLPDVRSNVAG